MQDGGEMDGTDLAAWLEAHRLAPSGLTLDAYVAPASLRAAIASLAARIAQLERVREGGAALPRAILLAGPVGTGTTFLTRVLASLVAPVPVYRLEAALLDPERIDALGRLLAMRRDAALVVLEEADALILDRDARQHDRTSRAGLLALLGAIDALPADHGALYLLTTSRPAGMIDAAVTRPGRCDTIVTLSRPTADELAALLRAECERRRLPWLPIEQMADALRGSTHAAAIAALDEAAGTAAAERRPLDRALVAAVLERRGEIDAEDLLDDAALRVAAVHESGHACVALALGQAVSSVRISRLRGGETHVGSDKRQPRRILGDGALLERVAIALGGLAAERVVLGEVSSGSASDTARATELVAHRLDGGGDPAWGVLSLRGLPDPGPALADRRDRHIAAVLEDQRRRAEGIVARERTSVERIAAALEVGGSLTGAQVAELCAGEALDAVDLVPILRP
jgi:cell division protease FtsH